jgi:hypothetical protein
MHLTQLKVHQELYGKFPVFIEKISGIKYT